MATSSAALPTSRRFRLRRPRWAVAVAVLLAVLLAVGWLWGRNSSLVAVKDVKISGVSGATAPEIERAIRGALRGTSTLTFDPQVVRAAVAAYPVVASVDVTTHFPNRATVVVHQRTPVGTILAGGKDVPVAKDGTLLVGTTARGLPTVASKRAPVDGRITDASTLAEVRVLAGASAAQRRTITRVGLGARGVEVQLSGGPVAYFGTADAPRDQWVALKRVLADPASQGASYIDVTVAERPAAGGFDEGAAGTGTDPGATADGSTDSGTDTGMSTGDGSVDGSSDGSGDGTATG